MHKLHTWLKKYGFHLALAGCLALLGGAAIYARSAMQPDVPPAPQPIAQVQGEPTAAPASVPAAQSLDEELSPLSWPVAGREVLKEYAPEPVWSDTLRQYQLHEGIDLAATLGEAVYAPADGRVTRVEKDALLGWLVEIDHGDGLITRCANLVSGEMTRSGDSVRAGQVIGAVGESATVEKGLPTHLHFEAWQEGEWVNLPDAREVSE